MFAVQCIAIGLKPFYLRKNIEGLAVMKGHALSVPILMANCKFDDDAESRGAYHAVMDEAIIMDLGRQAIWLCLVIGAPVMIVSLVVGVVVGLFQALTQIQEMTLTFVPKIIAIFLALFVMMPFMGGELVQFTRTLADQIVGLPTN